MCDLLRSIKLSCTNSLGPRLGVHLCLCSEAHCLRTLRGITAVDGFVLGDPYAPYPSGHAYRCFYIYTSESSAEACVPGQQDEDRIKKKGAGKL